MIAGSPYAPRDQPEKEGEGEREEKKKEKTWGYQAASVSEAQKLYFSKGTFIPCLYIEGNERGKVIQSQPKHSSSFALIKTRIFLHTFPTNDVVYSIFWPWRPVNIL